MFIVKLFTLTLYLVIVQNGVDTFAVIDCLYNQSVKHVSYICEPEPEEELTTRPSQMLECNNHWSNIVPSEILSLSFTDCTEETLTDSSDLNLFPNIRELEITKAGISNFQENVFRNNKHLERLKLTLNLLGEGEIPSNLFRETPVLSELNLSFNRLFSLNSEIFETLPKLKIINLSHNWISTLQLSPFARAKELQSLDLTNNIIHVIPKDFLMNNKNIKHLVLKNNLIFHMECEFLKTLSDFGSVNITINTLKALDASCVNDQNLTIIIEPSVSPITLRKSGDGFEWTFSKDNFEKLRYLNLSRSKIENVSAIIQHACMDLVSLDISYHFVGELKESTFERFVNLKSLYLRQTGLANFQFTTFYHQLNLESLDISYNNLSVIDFSFFLRNFRNLTWLNLEGNNLTELDTVTHLNFPKLSTLGISRNNFSCHYLAQFLSQWHNLTLIFNPSGKMHMGGIDCVHVKKPILIVENNETTTIKYSEDKNTDLLQSHLEELATVKTLMKAAVLILMIICIVFIVSKYKPVKKTIKTKFRNENRQSVAFESHTIDETMSPDVKLLEL